MDIDVGNARLLGGELLDQRVGAADLRQQRGAGRDVLPSVIVVLMLYPRIFFAQSLTPLRSPSLCMSSTRIR